MNYEELRPVTFEALRSFGKDESIQTTIVINKVQQILLSRGYYRDNQEVTYLSGGTYKMPEEDREIVREIVSELLQEGVLAWGLNIRNPNPPHMSLTRYGNEVIKGGTPQPYDPDGFLAYLKSQVPNIDDIILTYITEALQTFRRNNLLSAAVMTGVASERAFDLLLEAVTKAVTGPGQPEKFEKLKNDTKTKTKFDEVKKTVLRIPELARAQIDENLESNLDGVFNLIRVTRNDAGHPTGKTVRRDVAFVNLQLFVPYCKCVYGLISYLKNNNI